MMTIGNQSSDGDRIEARSPTDQRDTPDTPDKYATRYCANCRHAKESHRGRCLDCIETHVFGGICAAFVEPGVELNPGVEIDLIGEPETVTGHVLRRPDTRTPSAEGCGHDRHTSGASGIRWGHVPDDDGPTPWEPCSEPAPTEGTADRDALVERLARLYAHAKEKGRDTTAELAAGAIKALEDLTRENKRLRDQVLDERAAGPQVVHDLLRAEVERDAARAERDTLGARALDTLIEGGRCARRALRAEAQVAAVRAEMDHAFLNDHVLDRDCQGVAPGERVPAVRIDFLLAALAVHAPEPETTP